MKIDTPAGKAWFPAATKVFTPDYEVLIDKHVQKAVELAQKDADPAVADQQKSWAQANRR